MSIACRSKDCSLGYVTQIALLFTFHVRCCACRKNTANLAKLTENTAKESNSCPQGCAVDRVLCRNAANADVGEPKQRRFLLRRYLLSVKALLPCCILLSCKALLQSCALLLRNVLLQCYILLPSKVLLQSCVLLSSKALLLMPCCQVARVCSAKQLAKRSFLLFGKAIGLRSRFDKRDVLPCLRYC